MTHNHATRKGETMGQDQTETEFEAALLAEAGIKKEDDAYIVPSSDGRSSYRVTFAGRGDCDEVRLWECTCPARATCRHIRAVATINNQVCDEFGLD